MGLHVAVAKVEALRGDFADADRHLDIADRLAAIEGSKELIDAAGLVRTFVDVGVGNIKEAATQTSRAMAEPLALAGIKTYVSLMGNAGQLALWSGNSDLARGLLSSALEQCGAFSFLRSGLLDSSAALSLFVDDLPAAAATIEECRALIASHEVPARSWYDLTHDITRCLYFARLEDWQSIIDIVDEADPELERRHLRTWRTSLLAARAKAHARLGEHDAAEASLLDAMRVCPKGAVDPMIALETATATCQAARGNVVQAHRHFDRALRASEAIGHQFHHWVVSNERESWSLSSTDPADTRAPVPESHGDPGLLLSEVTGLLASSHSLDLLSTRVISILESSSMRARFRVDVGDGLGESDGTAATWEVKGSHGFRLQLSSPTKSTVISVSHLTSLEELTFVKNLTDLVATALKIDDDADTHLWPEAEATGPDEAIFRSPRMRELRRIAVRLADTGLPILIVGETGTGKEVFARLIHDNSRVKRGPFIAYNASTMPRDIAESQLFGHRRGAFTGALESSGGVIRAAERGTLFLDEIGDLELAVQPKLLRFLELGEIHPLGEPRPLHVQVRVVAATNAPLPQLVADGRFRSDLWYRLQVSMLTLPPLRERKDEIPALTAYFVRKAAAEARRERIQVGDDVLAALLLYDWPGNLRQLYNEIRRLVALAHDGDTIRSEDLSPNIAGPWRQTRPTAAPAQEASLSVRLDQPLDLAIADVERAFIEHALAQTQGRVTDAAQVLGISRKGLFLKRKKLGLE